MPHNLLIASQVVLSLQLFFAVIPLIIFTSDRQAVYNAHQLSFASVTSYLNAIKLNTKATITFDRD